MSPEIYLIVAITIIGYIGSKIYLHLKKVKAKEAYKITEDFIDEYFIEVKKAFDNYQLNFKIHKYDVLSKAVKIKQSKKYVKSDFIEALIILKNDVIRNTYESFFFENYAIISNMHYDKLIKYFYKSSHLLKFEIINESTINLATKLAIEEYEKQNIKLSNALEFIALYSYNLKTTYGYYPDSVYVHLKEEIREIKELNYPIKSLTI